MEEMQRLNVVVLEAMAVSKLAADDKNREQAVIRRVTAPATGNQRILDFSTAPTSSEVPYLKLDLRGKQIRLFELYPITETSSIEGSSDAWSCLHAQHTPRSLMLGEIRPSVGKSRSTAVLRSGSVRTCGGSFICKAL
jgi:hypothetical protein